MTITTTKSSDVFPGNGSSGPFDCTWRIFDDTDVTVALVDQSTGASTPLVLNTDYTISGAGNQAGFTVATVSPVVSGKSLYVKRALAFTQPTDFTNQGAFFPTMHEDAMDRLEMQIQQQNDDLGRSLKANAVTGNFETGGKRVTGAANAVDPGDLTTLSQVDQLVTGAASGITPTDVALYSKLASAVAGAGSALVAFLQSGANAAARLVQDKLRERVTVKDYRRSSDTDDTQAFTRAINAWNATGVRFRIPAGTYTVSSALPAINYSAGTSETYAGKINIWGDGADCTVINYTGTSGSLFTIQGGQNSSIVSHATFGGFLINGPGSGTSTTGLTITNMARGCFRDIAIYGFGTGVTATDILSSIFDNFHVNQCGTIGTLAKGTFSEPNAIRWTGCQFGNNGQGLYINGAVTNTLDGCIFESNGQASSGYQLKVTAGTDGYAAFSLNGCYFEGGYGLADVLVSASSGCVFDIENCQFNRLSGTQFVTNNISITSSASVNCKIDRCGFMGGGTYVANSGRPYIAISAPLYVIDGGRNGYASLTEKPNLSNSPGIVPAAMPNAWVRFAGTTGVIGRSFNVASVTRTGTGVYNIVINQLSSSGGFNTYACSLSSAGYWAITGESGNTVTLSTFNTSGVAADIGVVGFTMFGGADIV